MQLLTINNEEKNINKADILKVSGSLYAKVEYNYNGLVNIWRV